MKKSLIIGAICIAIAHSGSGQGLERNRLIVSGGPRKQSSDRTRELITSQNTSSLDAGLNFRYAAKRSTPCVVYVDALFQEPMSKPHETVLSQLNVQRASSSGVIVNSNGYIVTNYHAVAGASSIQILLPDERQYIAEVIGNGVRLNDRAWESLTGVCIDRVDPKGMAGNRGLLVGDIIVRIDEKTVPSETRFRELLATYRPGDQVMVAFIRGGSEFRLLVPLMEDQQ